MQFRRISAFFYVLIVLLAFNLIFNLFFKWYGVSLIVRVYLFVFSFYLIFNYASFGTDRLKTLFRARYGKRADIRLFLEFGVMPYVIIYGITMVFTFIDYLRLGNWPWNPLFALLNGRYSNLVIYSLLLFLVLKIGKGPGWKIALFIAAAVLYFFVDKLLYAAFPGGPGIVGIKIVKMAVIVFFLFFEFFREKNKAMLASVSLASAAIIIASVILVYAGIFRYSEPLSYQKKETGLLLLRYGFAHPCGEMRRIVAEKSDLDLFRQLVDEPAGAVCAVNFTREQWAKLLCSGPVTRAAIEARSCGEADVDITYERLLEYSAVQVDRSLSEVRNARHFNALAARYLSGNEEDFMRRIEGGDESFRLWGIAILGEVKSPGSVPFLIERLTDKNTAIADAAYESLRKITGIDPATSLKARRNDPSVLYEFREHHLRNRKDR